MKSRRIVEGPQTTPHRALLFGTNLRATVATTVPNFVRGSLVLVAMLFKALIAPLGLVGAAIAVGIGSLGVAFLGLFSLPETYGVDLDYHEPDVTDRGA